MALSTSSPFFSMNRRRVSALAAQRGQRAGLALGVQLALQACGRSGFLQQHLLVLGLQAVEARLVHHHDQGRVGVPRQG
jgi:hypothetical protein